MPFRLFAAKRRHANRRKDAIRTDEKTQYAKGRNNPREKTEFQREKTKNKNKNKNKTFCEKTNLKPLYFVVFLRGVFLSFRTASFRLA